VQAAAKVAEAAKSAQDAVQPGHSQSARCDFLASNYKLYPGSYHAPRAPSFTLANAVTKRP